MKGKPLDPTEFPRKEGFTPIPDDLMEDLIEEADTAVAIVLYVSMQTDKQGVRWITITVPELSRALERRVSEVRRGLKKAVERGRVVREDLENGFRLSVRDLKPNRSSET